jgi:hypothetical protein
MKKWGLCSAILLLIGASGFYGLDMIPTSCQGCDNPAEKLPDTIDTSHPHPPTDTDMCAPACARMRELQCPEAAPLDDGTTCEEFCVQTQMRGHGLNPTCIAQIKTCQGVTECTENP